MKKTIYMVLLGLIVCPSLLLSVKANATEVVHSNNAWLTLQQKVQNVQYYQGAIYFLTAQFGYGGMVVTYDNSSEIVYENRLYTGHRISLPYLEKTRSVRPFVMDKYGRIIYGKTLDLTKLT